MVNTSKLSPSIVVQIRVRREGGEKLKSISDAFGVSQTMVSLIARKRNWKHV